MNKIKYLSFTIVLVVLFGVACFPAMADEKIGFYDMRQVIQGSDAGKKAEEEVRKINAKYEPRLKEIQAELTKLKEDLDKQRSVLKPEKISEMEMTGKKKYVEFERLRKDYTDEVQTKGQELERKAIPEIMKIVHNIGEKERYKMIVETSQILGIYFSKDADLTKRITDEFNRISKSN